MNLILFFTITVICLFVPLNVNAISVDEFEKQLQGIQTSDDAEILISNLFKNTDYLKTCKDLAIEMKAELDSDSVNWEKINENNKNEQGR